MSDKKDRTIEEILDSLRSSLSEDFNIPDNALSAGQVAEGLGMPKYSAVRYLTRLVKEGRWARAIPYGGKSNVYWELE